MKGCGLMLDCEPSVSIGRHGTLTSPHMVHTYVIMDAGWFCHCKNNVTHV